MPIGKAKPMVVLFGWLGCQQRQFAKYVELWERIGVAPLACLRPSLLQAARPGRADAYLLEFMRRATDDFSARSTSSSPAARPQVFVQCLSNAGFMAYGAAVHLASRTAAPGGGRLPPHLETAAAQATLGGFRKLLRATAGHVIDSAPSRATPGIWSRGIASAALGRPAQEVEDLEARHPVLARAAFSLTQRFLALPSVSRQVREVRQAWREEVPPVPQLYLYSRADALIPWQQVEVFAEQQERRGVAVDAFCWADSGHVEHLKCHPVQYEQLVRSFVEQCMRTDRHPENFI